MHRSSVISLFKKYVLLLHKPSPAIKIPIKVINQFTLHIFNWAVMLSYFEIKRRVHQNYDRNWSYLKKKEVIHSFDGGVPLPLAEIPFHHTDDSFKCGSYFCCSLYNTNRYPIKMLTQVLNKKIASDQSNSSCSKVPAVISIIVVVGAFPLRVWYESCTGVLAANLIREFMLYEFRNRTIIKK